MSKRFNHSKSFFFRLKGHGNAQMCAISSASFSVRSLSLSEVGVGQTRRARNHCSNQITVVVAIPIHDGPVVGIWHSDCHGWGLIPGQETY